MTGTGRRSQEPQQKSPGDTVERSSWLNSEVPALWLWFGTWVGRQMASVGEPVHSAVSPPLAWLGCLGEASFVALITIRWQAGTFPENPNHMCLWRLLDVCLTVGGCLEESLESFLGALVPRHCLESTGFGSRHELYSSQISSRFL